MLAPMNALSSILVINKVDDLNQKPICKGWLKNLSISFQYPDIDFEVVVVLYLGFSPSCLLIENKK